MKLTDLNPRWLQPSQYTLPSGMMVFPAYDSIKRMGCGLTFDDQSCPGQRLGVFFANPIDGLPPADGHKLWQRTGDTFETLTLSPSINTEAPERPNGWHGFITNGEIQ